MRKLLIAACALALIPGAALAQYHPYLHGRVYHPALHPHFGDPRPGFGPGPGPLTHFAAGPIAHFGARDMSAWRGGYWWHGWRGGRFGWWWGAGDFWYWYEAPIYPYPDSVADYYVAANHPAPQAGATWWYCADPPGYYPTVRGCPTPWRPVAATPQPY